MPLARTSRGPAQAHGRGGFAPAHQGSRGHLKHERAGPAGAALLWIHVHLREPTSVVHLLHVLAP